MEGSSLTKAELTKNSTRTEFESLKDFSSVYIKSRSKSDEKIESEDSLSLSNQSSSKMNLPPKSMADLLNKTNDFHAFSSNQLNSPLIAYWYGLCKFVVITPTRSSNYIDTESRANLVLSSVSVAINNSGCHIPILVQVNSSNREMYIGLCEGSALKTHFQIVEFNYTPPQYSYLSGLLDVFKSKLVNSISKIKIFY